MYTCDYSTKLLINNKSSPPIMTANIHLFWVKLFKEPGNYSAVLGDIASDHERTQIETEISACLVTCV
jgi:hypothetical protein